MTLSLLSIYKVIFVTAYTHHRCQDLVWSILCEGFVQCQTKNHNRGDHQQSTHKNTKREPQV